LAQAALKRAVWPDPDHAHQMTEIARPGRTETARRDRRCSVERTGEAVAWAFVEVIGTWRCVGDVVEA
jgi:hypothetical protein